MEQENEFKTDTYYVDSQGLAGWEVVARKMLRDEMQSKRVRYKELSKRLKAFGINEDPDRLGRKINRKKFPAALFLVCMTVLKVERMNVPVFGKAPPTELEKRFAAMGADISGKTVNR